MDAEIGWESLSEEDRKRIRQNPLWMREIGLAEFQQKRHLERVKAGAPMREGDDEEIRARNLNRRAPPDPVIHCISPAFQWLPRSICQESSFNRFIAKQTHQSHPSGI